MPWWASEKNRSRVWFAVLDGVFLSKTDRATLKQLLREKRSLILPYCRRSARPSIGFAYHNALRFESSLVDQLQSRYGLDKLFPSLFPRHLCLQPSNKMADSG